MSSAEPTIHILVVDDDSLILDLIQQVLTTRGYGIVTAEDGETAILLASERPFDLIVLDANMPKLNGFETLHRLAANKSTSSIPVMMLTALKQPEGVEAALKLGAKDYLAKPFDVSKLIERIERLLAKFPKPRRPEEGMVWKRNIIFDPPKTGPVGRTKPSGS